MLSGMMMFLDLETGYIVFGERNSFCIINHTEQSRRFRPDRFTFSW
jgi:hypothetical protein